jgi:hypothetical protein
MMVMIDDDDEALARGRAEASNHEVLVSLGKKEKRQGNESMSCFVLFCCNA